MAKLKLTEEGKRYIHVYIIPQHLSKLSGDCATLIALMTFGEIDDDELIEYLHNTKGIQKVTTRGAITRCIKKGYVQSDYVPKVKELPIIIDYIPPPEVSVEVYEHHCLRCGGNWTSYLKSPKACSRCRSFQWSTPYKQPWLKGKEK